MLLFVTDDVNVKLYVEKLSQIEENGGKFSVIK